MENDESKNSEQPLKSHILNFLFNKGHICTNIADLTSFALVLSNFEL